MHPFKKMILSLVLITEITPPPTTGTATLQRYMRDGSQSGASFHLPYIDYTDEYGNPATFYADKDFDICGSFMAISITSIHYCTECV